MRTRQHSTRWLGLALASGFLTFAVTTQAAKPPKPPPAPSGPAYRIVSLGILGVDTLGATAVNNAGWVAGGDRLGTSQSPVALVVVPEPSANGPVYFRDTSPADGINDLIQILPDLPNTSGSGPFDINDSGMIAGTWIPESDNPELLEWEVAALWVGNTPVVLGNVGGPQTYAYGINNPGLVVTGPNAADASYGIGLEAPSCVIVPKDTNGDGVPETWFEDLNGDGINDLLNMIAPASGPHFFQPRAINDAGQVILNCVRGPERLVTPDFTDTDGDGNPWYADVNGDGTNDLMVAFIGLGGAGAYVADINSPGQVAGTSNGRAVRWDIAADGTQTITDLGLLSREVRKMNATGINDAGQIVGAVAYRRSSSSFLFENGKLYDLATLLVNGTGWTGLGAGDINNQGVIFGNGDLNGVRQGFVAIPVTQP